jgi:polar amino acid transport system substrate-binding protein
VAEGTASPVAPSGAAGGTTAPALPACTSGALPTMTSGKLTVGTASPHATPWYVGDSPANGEGLEAAVAYAVAQALGYGRDQVSWAAIDPAQASAGTTGGFDVDLNQFTAPDAGSATADYSTGYFSVTDALVTRPDAVPASATEITGLPLGAVKASSGASTAQRVTQRTPTVFVDQNQALAALRAGSVPGVVLPVTSALIVAAADPSIVLVGQLSSDPTVQPDQLKVLLPKNSALTGCVSAAIDRLRVEGTLEQLAHQWVDPQAPEIG